MESVGKRKLHHTRTRLPVQLVNVQNSLLSVIKCVNRMPGPKVCWDDERNCYGLKADRTYTCGEKVTTYGGHMCVQEGQGDYVAKTGELYIDGEYDFFPEQKGRWINESDRDRTIVNVKLGRDVRATRDIEEGEWLFADYGEEYVRNY